MLPSIGFTRVRVCVSCVFKHAQRVQPYSPRAEDTLSMSLPTEESRAWLNSHLHSPLSKSDDGDSDTEDYSSSDSFESCLNNNNNNHSSSYDNQHSPQHKSPSKCSDNNNSSMANQYEFQCHQNPSYRPQKKQTQQRGNNQLEASASAASTSSPIARSETRGASPPMSASSPTSSWSHPWPKPPAPADEASRLDALHALRVLDSAPEKPYDMICDLAKARLSCPMAAVSFMDEHRQWFKASAGLAHKMIPRKIAFCAYTVSSKEPVVVLDTLKDARFEHNPLVSGAAAVRFYAAAPILDPSTGHAVGSVFVLDTRPRESCDVTILERLAHAASDNLPQTRQEHLSSSQMHEEKHEQPSIVKPAPSSPAAVAPMPSSLTSSSPAIKTETQLVQVTPMSPLSTILTTATADANNSSSSAVASNDQMEVLLMRLLTQNTETQQQLATQQMSISSTLGFHSTQISKLMTDFARMEAKIEAKIK